MYRVYCDDELIYDTRVDDKNYILHDAKLDLELNKAGSFNFTIYPSHARYGTLYPLKSIITVYQDDYLIFRGRILNTVKGFYNEEQVLCEGELAFLCDSIQRPLNLSTLTVKELFALLIERHNEQVDENKRFKIGNVSLTNGSNHAVSPNEKHSVTWNVMSEKLIDNFGGYLWVRHENDGNYIDYVSDFDTLGNQPVKFGKNLLSIKRENRGEDIATALIPVGATSDIDIKSVNGGSDYIYDVEAVKQYGWIFRTETFDDVTSPRDLLEKAQSRLRELSTPYSSIEVGAADLSSIEDFNAFRLGTYVTADSSIHGLDADFIVKKLQITLAKPSANKLTLNGVFESLTQMTNPQGIKNEIIKTTETAIAKSESELAEKVEELVEEEVAKSELEITKKVEEAIDGLSLEVSELSEGVNARLDLTISVNEEGVVQSAIGASADTIKFESNKLIIESDNCDLSADGTMRVRAGNIGGCEIVNGVLQVDAANIEGELTAKQIDTTGLEADIVASVVGEDGTIIDGGDLHICKPYEQVYENLSKFKILTFRCGSDVFNLYITFGVDMDGAGHIESLNYENMLIEKEENPTEHWVRVDIDALRDVGTFKIIVYPNEDGLAYFYVWDENGNEVVSIYENNVTYPIERICPNYLTHGELNTEIFSEYEIYRLY